MSSRDLIPKKSEKKPGQAELKALAEFRYQIRRYLRYMEEKARARGYHPQQYQLLLAIEEGDLLRRVREDRDRRLVILAPLRRESA